MTTEGDRSTWTLAQRAAHKRELRERRTAWEQEHARKKEQERLSRAREELQEEKKRRLTHWMENGGDPADFDRAWPSMMQQIIEERYALEQYERLSRVEDIFS
jgi:uncharacterized protein with von Willebrand factor type A (vWA) domain